MSYMDVKVLGFYPSKAPVEVVSLSLYASRPRVGHVATFSSHGQSRSYTNEYDRRTRIPAKVICSPWHGTPAQCVQGRALTVKQ